MLALASASCRDAREVIPLVVQSLPAKPSANGVAAGAVRKSSRPACVTSPSASRGRLARTRQGAGERGERHALAAAERSFARRTTCATARGGIVRSANDVGPWAWRRRSREERRGPVRGGIVRSANDMRLPAWRARSVGERRGPVGGEGSFGRRTTWRPHARGVIVRSANDPTWSPRSFGERPRGKASFARRTTPREGVVARRKTERPGPVRMESSRVRYFSQRK